MDGRVAIEVEGGVADVRLTRGDKMNALDPAMFAAIADAIAWLSQMSGLRAVVLSGEGRAFCAGLDMAAMASGGSGLDLELRSHGLANAVQQVGWGWRMLPVPVIAAAHGVAYGGGLQVFAGADVRLVAPDTRLSVMEMKWGLVPDMAGMALWRGLVRDDHLRECIYTARVFTADEAVAMGFASRIEDDPRAAALELSRTVAERNPEAVRAAKRLCNLMAEGDAAALLAAESREQLGVIRTPNQIEAVQANLAGRAPVFQD